jgi:hypothetical protein
MIGGQHFSERLDGNALTILLRKIAHADFRVIALDSVFEERLTRLVFGGSGTN